MPERPLPVELKLLDAGDGALTLQFGETIDPRTQAAVQGLDRAIAGLEAAGGLPGLIEVVPTFRSLTVLYDPLRLDRAGLLASLQPLLAAHREPVGSAGRRWRLPVCYGGDAGPDLAETARALKRGADELAELHAGSEYRVLMLGFLPGFAFLGELPEDLRLPRRPEPRLRVPAGSVAIAGSLTAIYPWESPGGWHLLGRCPVPLFDPGWPSPALLQVGDRVGFQPVNQQELGRLEGAVRGGEIGPEAWLAGEAGP